MRELMLAMAICIAVDASLVGVSALRADPPRQLASLPVQAGLAGSFAGISNGALLFAGGANFPDKKPWEGGAKVWTDRVFALEKPDGDWKEVGKLTRALGYGICVTHRDAVVCVGGSDAQRCYADAFRLQLQRGKVECLPLPPLPMAVANAAGALVGDRIFVAGGLTDPKATSASRKVWTIDLAAATPTWKEIDRLPGEGRMLAVAAGYDDAFWIIGGVQLSADKQGKARRHYLNDAYCYRPDRGWQRIADLPNPLAAAPSPAPSDFGGFYILGGDDGSQVVALPEKHRGFDDKILRYTAAADKWEAIGKLAAPRATTPCVLWDKAWVIPSGEMRPGVRSPEVWTINLPELKPKASSVQRLTFRQPAPQKGGA